jgi:hypothetical protein
MLSLIYVHILRAYFFVFQILVSPGYGRNEYPGGLECLYIMKAPQVTENLLRQTFRPYKPVILYDLKLLSTVPTCPYMYTTYCSVFYIKLFMPDRIRLQPFKSFWVRKQRRFRPDSDAYLCLYTEMRIRQAWSYFFLSGSASKNCQSAYGSKMQLQ